LASPTLETPRLILRTITPDDRDGIVALLSDKVAMEHMRYKAWDDEQCQGWVDTALEIAGQSDPDGTAWVIERKDTGEVIGWLGISNPADPVHAYNVNFEYALARPHWNQGYMTEVLRGVFAYEFDTLGVPQLAANCHPPNIGSSRAMEKGGMRYTHSSRGPDMDGNWWEQNHYRITRDEWNALKD
jgi:[ribosomal protein S5]-alanine N-acetyltransferase